MTELRKIRRALISLSDKSGAVEFVNALSEFGVQIISTGGTAHTLREAGVNVTDVSEVTGFPEMMDGRVKTLHPKIHGALLAVRDDQRHVAAMRQHGIEPIDMVAVNLYPFEQTIAREGVSLIEAVENIDIGGPSMIRSAAKNWRDVAVVTDPQIYDRIIEEMRENEGSLSLETRQRLAVQAYARTAAYDLAISSYLAAQIRSASVPQATGEFPPQRRRDAEKSEGSAKSFPPYKGGEAAASAHGVILSVEGELPQTVTLNLAKITDLRYGENSHQKAALYQTGETGGIANAEPLHGKEMSYNNYVDAEAAWQLVQDFGELTVAIIKHTNPSGVGTGQDNEQAYRRALSTDPVSAFGGIVAFNRPLDAAAARAVNEVFTEVVIAPQFDNEALEIFKIKKNLRVLRTAQSSPPYEGGVAAASADGVVLSSANSVALALRQISGGMLLQEKDVHKLFENDLKVVTPKRPTAKQIRALLLAWRACKHVKSNAIVFANENQTIGVGAGQMNRVDSLRIAAMRAERFNLPLRGSVVASDAFFPFRDTVDEAAKYGVSAIIQPGGSVRDEESIQAADEHGISMIFTGIRHFNH